MLFRREDLDSLGEGARLDPPNELQRMLEKAVEVFPVVHQVAAARDRHPPRTRLEVHSRPREEGRSEGGERGDP
jgi:hypothetical protein